MKNKGISGNIRFVTSTPIKKDQMKVVKDESKTIEGKEDFPIVAWPIDPSALFTTYDNSFLISGIINKISSSGNTGFEDITNTELKAFIDRLDVKKALMDLGIFGNAFFERIMTRGNKLHSLKPIIATSMSVRGNKSFQQQTSKQIDLAVEEIFQAKLPSVSNSFYGDCLYSGCIQQIALLQLVDKYYVDLFKRGLFNPILLADENGDMTDKAQTKLQATLQDQFRGSENLQSIGILPGKYKVIELVKNMDTNAFLAFRSDLIKSIAISMNISYSMLVNDNSNRATAGTEYEVFLKEIVKPMQKMFLDQLKAFLKQYDFFPAADIDALEFKTVDTKNELEQMKTRTGYVSAGIVTPNEARLILGYSAVDGGDVIRTRLTPEQTQQELDQIDKKVAEIYK